MMASPRLLPEHQHLLKELRQMLGAGERVGATATPLKGILKNNVAPPPRSPSPSPPPPPPPAETASVLQSPPVITTTHYPAQASPGGSPAHEQLHVHVMVQCSCERPPTTEASTQTMDESSRKVTFNDIPHRMRCKTPLAGYFEDLEGVLKSGDSAATRECEESVKEVIPHGSLQPPTRTASNGSRPKSSKKARRRSVEEVLNRVRDTLLEVLEEASPAEFTVAPPQPQPEARWNCASALLESLFRGDGEDDSLGVAPLETPPKQQEALNEPPERDWGPLRHNLTSQKSASGEAAVSSASKSPTVLASPSPQSARLTFDCKAEVRRMISDELVYIHDEVKSRWDETCVRLRNDFGRKYRAFLDDCRQCLRESKQSDREQLRQEMLEARKELLAELKTSFRLTCLDFENWWKEYIQNEVRESQSFLRKGKSYRVLAGVLKYEIMESVAGIEEDTRRKAADLWKELVAQRSVSFETLFQDTRES